MTCSICELPGDVLAAINKKMRDRIPDTTIAQEFNVSRPSLGRHRRAGHHELVPQDPADLEPVEIVEEAKELAKSAKTREVVQAGPMTPEEIFKFAASNARSCERKRKVAERHGKDRAALDWSKEGRAWTELAAKLEGLLQGNQTQVNVLVANQASEVLGDIRGALERVCSKCRGIILETLERAETQATEVDYEVVS